MAGIGTASAGETTRGRQGLRGAAAFALLAAMLTLSACGTWADPTQLFGDDDDAPPSATTATGSPTAASSDRFPNLARVPPKPVEVTSAGERRQAVDSLAADRSNARYTDEELRARPADSTTPPPSPRAPVSQLPAGTSMQPRGATQPSPGAAPQAMAAAPVGQPQPVAAPARGANVVDSFSQGLAQSSATTLPAGLAQPQAGGAPSYAAPSYAALPGASQLLAIVRFNANERTLGRDDRDLIKKTAEYFKGVGGKGQLRVVSYAPSQAQGAVAQNRAELVSAELRKHGIAISQIRQENQTASAAPAYYETAARATDQSRRVEIYIVN